MKFQRPSGITAVSTLIALALGGSSIYFMIRSNERVSRIDSLQNRVVLSRNFLITGRGSPPGNAFDGNLHTFWRESFTPALLKGSRSESPSAVPDPERLFLQSDAGLTHSPGRPPLPAPPTALKLHFPEDTTCRRPSRVQIHLFLQDVVDVDREVRYPDVPSYSSSATTELPPEGSSVLIPLQPILEVSPSPRFPIHVDLIWYRLEFLDFYRSGENCIEISEVETVH